MTQAQDDRSGFIGGSDVAAIVGLSPWKTRYALWEEKVYGVREEIDPQRAAIFDWGKRLEPLVIQKLEDTHGLLIAGRNRIVYDETYPWMRAEIDFEYFEGEELDNGDVKTANAFTKESWGPSGSDEVPMYYVAQFQWGMMLSGAKRCLCAVLFGANDLRLYTVDRDEHIIQYLRANAVQFWDNNVIGREPPEAVTAQDAEKIMVKFDGITLTASPDVHRTVKRLYGVKQAIKRLEALEADMADGLRIALAQGLNLDAGGEQTPGKTAIVDSAGRPLLTWNPQTTNRISVTALKEKYPDIAAECTETSTFRRMLIKEKNLG